MAIFKTFLSENGENDIFRKNPKMSLPYSHDAATLSKTLEKSYDLYLYFDESYKPLFFQPILVHNYVILA